MTMWIYALGAAAALVALNKKPTPKPVPLPKPGPGPTRPAGTVYVPRPISNEEGDGDGLQWAQSLPPDTDKTRVRDKMIVKAVANGMANMQFSELVLTGFGHTLRFPVLSRTLRIGKTNPVRVTVDYESMQEICDLTASAMLTSKLSDEIYKAAALKILPPRFQNWQGPGTDNSGSKTYRMVEYSQILDTIVPLSFAGLVSNEAKQWVNTKRFWVDNIGNPPQNWPAAKASGNYGYYNTTGTGSSVPSIPGLSVIQSVGLRHNFYHVDYSQEVQVIGQWGGLDGYGAVHIGSVLKHPVLCKLVAYDGPLPSWAHPAFNKPDTPTIVLPGV